MSKADGNGSREHAEGGWAQRHLTRQWWLYGLLLAGWWIFRSLTRGYSPLVTCIGVVPAFVLGVAALVVRRRREARAVGGGIEPNELPELEALLRHREVPDDPNRRQQVLALTRWQQRRTRRLVVIELAAAAALCLFLAGLVIANGDLTAGLALGGGALLAIGVTGFLLMRFGLRRMDRFAARLTAAH